MIHINFKISLIKLLLLSAFITSTNLSAQVVSTYAGSTQGLTNGAAASSQFYGPAGVACAADGTLYVVDRVNSVIRKITPSGIVSTFAGSTEGFADGIGSAAKFNFPMGIAIDAIGVLYVADSYNHRIRKITSDGEVTTISGTVAGFLDGSTSVAQFYYPEGVFVDASGTIYIGDAGNNRIRKITTGGQVVTIAGNDTVGNNDGIGTAAQFWTPSGVVVDNQGTIFVAEKHHRIRKVTADGTVTTLVGNGTPGYVDGTGSGVRFNVPFGIALDATGNIFVTEAVNSKIRKITIDGTVTTIAGGMSGYADGAGNLAKFNSPIGITFGIDGSIYIGDSGNNKVRKITQNLANATNAIATDFNIYPNPTSGILNFEFKNSAPTAILVYDLAGKLVDYTKDGATTNQIDISKFVNGSYIIQVTTNEGTFSKKVIKQ